MSLVSNTGLLASVQSLQYKKRNNEEDQCLSFSNIIGPAPFALRPFAGLYNPFPYGCSILCNHPTDCEVKDIVKRAKDAWGTDCKTTLQEEIAALRATAMQHAHAHDDADSVVPEELFRRYTETDSRPLTPAPTLASVITHISHTAKGGRRCFTPDPLPTSHHASERPLLVLDLRRTQSQDTISWHGGPGGPVPTTVLQPPTRSPTPNSNSAGTITRRSKKSTSPSKKSATSETKTNDDSNSDGNKLEQQVMKTLPAPNADGGVDSSEAEEIQRRRGRQRKKNKKHSRDLSSGVEKEFKGLPEPGETQVSAFGNESRVGSARQSLTVMGADGQMTPRSRASLSARGSHGGDSNVQPSFVHHDLLKLLSRQLDREVIDNEFDMMRRIALEEAYRVFPPNSYLGQSEEVTKVKKELRLPPTDIELWLSLPRTFSRQSARFELPLDREVFNTMTPLEYIRQHVSITSGRRMLYNLVFNRHRENSDMEVEDRRISGEKIIAALGEMMGRPMTEEESNKFQSLVGWTNADSLDFRAWCGLCALCERIMGPSFSSQVVSQEIDARHEVEKADFDTLPRRLLSLKPDPRLLSMLMQIRDC